MRRALAVALLLAGCEKAAPDAPAVPQAGAALERAALAAGIVADPANVDPVGAFASETDRACVVPQGSGYRVGASVDYGEQQGCVARGTATGRETLRIDFGDQCRFDARFDGERIVFPATVPTACDRRCTGRASLTALSVARLSNTESEARTIRGSDGQPLCG